MIKNLNAYLSKRIADDTWGISTWFIGSYLYLSFGIWMRSTFVIYSTNILSILILAYSITVTILIYQSKDIPERRKKIIKSSVYIILSILLVWYSLPTRSYPELCHQQHLIRFVTRSKSPSYAPALRGHCLQSPASACLPPLPRERKRFHFPSK